jgi:hypothetical protein
VASGHVQLWPSGAFDFGARVQFGIPFGAPDPRRAPVFVSASLEGWVANKAFSAEAAAELLVLGQRAARGELLISSVGWAACGQLGWLRGGAARRWTEPTATVLAGSCDVGPYRARRSAAAAQDGPLTLRLPDSSAGTMLRFRGNGGPPRVVLEGPGGQRVAASADGSPVVNSRFVVLQDPSASATQVAIRRPAGTWRVTVADGSPTVAGVDSADVLDRPKVSARVGGRGAKRTLTWKLSPRPGQRVTFAEEGGDSAAVITKTSAARGRVRFTPEAGNGRARRIVATVEQSGTPRDALTVARYTAPAWRKPARPSRLRAKRSGSNLIITWRAAARAARYSVYVTSADGDRQVFILSARKRRLKVRDVQKDDRATVQVAGLRSDNAPGRPAILKLKPVKRR